MTGKDPWSQLSLLLQQECRVYEQLLELLNDEWTVLRTLQYQRLVQIASQKEEILASITNLERDRVICGKGLHKDGSQGKSLKWLVESTHPHAIPAKQALRKLMSIGSQVEQLSNRNSGLLSRGLHVVREAMMVVQEGLGLVPVYGESGQLSSPSVATSLNLQG
ncbi:MAG: flagellar export chaperone FlgN [Nitrospirales bacterium]